MPLGHAVNLRVSLSLTFSLSRPWTAMPLGRVANDRLRYMPIGYARVSKAEGSQSLDLQRDARRAEGIDAAANLYHDFASGARDDRPGLDSCLRALRKGDVLVVWKLDRLGRNLAHLVLVQDDQPVLGLVHRQAVGQLERVAAFVWNASRQPPWASMTSSISAMMWMVSLRATTIFW